MNEIRLLSMDGIMSEPVMVSLYGIGGGFFFLGGQIESMELANKQIV